MIVSKTSNYGSKKRELLGAGGRAKKVTNGAQRIGAQRTDKLLAVALGIDEPGVGKLFDVVGYRRCGEVQIAEQVAQEARRVAARDVDARLLEQIHEQREAMLITERLEHAGEFLGVGSHDTHLDTFETMSTG